MDYFLTEEQQMIKEIARKIAEEKIKPVRAELDEKEVFHEEFHEVCFNQRHIHNIEYAFAVDLH